MTHYTINPLTWTLYNGEWYADIDTYDAYNISIRADGAVILRYGVDSRVTTIVESVEAGKATAQEIHLNYVESFLTPAPPPQ